MAQEYTVKKAFQATVSKEDKTPKVVEFNGHKFNAWKIQVENQAELGIDPKQWININKNPGNEIKEGDTIYGDVNAIEGRFGVFYNFKSASRPLGELPIKKPEPVAQSDDEALELINDKLDYVIGMLEEMSDPELAKAAEVIPGAKKVELEDLDI